MSVVKIHTDDLHSIYDILGDLLARKQGRPSATAAEDLRSRAGMSLELVGHILGITRPIVVPPTAVEPIPERTVEEVVEAVAAEITPEVGPLADAPEAVVEGDEAEA